MDGFYVISDDITLLEGIWMKKKKKRVTRTTSQKAFIFFVFLEQNAFAHKPFAPGLLEMG